MTAYARTETILICLDWLYYNTPKLDNPHIQKQTIQLTYNEILFSNKRTTWIKSQKYVEQNKANEKMTV